MILWCSTDGDKQVNALVCVYSCPCNVKIKCKAYTEAYEKIKAMLIDGKYLGRYGIPTFDVPLALRPKKEKKVSKPRPIPKPPKVQEVSAETKPKRKRRTKAEMEALKCHS